MITLKDLSSIGLAKKSDPDTAIYYENWKNLDAPVYASEEEAKVKRPDIFPLSQKRYSHASGVCRFYYLSDGRTVVKIGHDWDFPSPGSKICYYFSDEYKWQREK